MSDFVTKMQRLWDTGQQHLGAGRYVAAREMLEAAERIAWRRRDGVDLVRIYLPLLEIRRQIRLNAAEGVLSVGGDMRAFLKAEAGTIFLRGPGGRRDAERVWRESRRSGRALEAIVLIELGEELRMTSPRDGTFAGGLKAELTRDEKRMIGASTELDQVVPLPPLGTYTTGPLHAMGRESLLVGWEALALKWQRRHPPRKAWGPWEEMAWLRQTLRVDAACEPVSMRIMTLGEGVGRVRKP